MSTKKFVGEVVSNKMKSTVVVLVDNSKRHPIYGKIVKRTKRFKAHSDFGCMVGDKVEIVETKPCSKQVSFKVLRKLEE